MGVEAAVGWGGSWYRQVSGQPWDGVEAGEDRRRGGRGVGWKMVKTGVGGHGLGWKLVKTGVEASVGWGGSW